MTLAVVRSLGSGRRLRSPTELEDFEQELVDQYALAMAASGVTDAHVAQDRGAVVEFVRFLGRPVWTTEPEDVDRYLVYLRKQRGQAKKTVQAKAWNLAQFFDFLIIRYQGDIHALTGCVLEQPVDEYNRPAKADYGVVLLRLLAQGPGHTATVPVVRATEALFRRWAVPPLPPRRLPRRRFVPALPGLGNQCQARGVVQGLHQLAGPLRQQHCAMRELLADGPAGCEEVLSFVPQAGSDAAVLPPRRPHRQPARSAAVSGRHVLAPATSAPGTAATATGAFRHEQLMLFTATIDLRRGIGGGTALGPAHRWHPRRHPGHPRRPHPA
ncbi:hypothetical protein [Actinomadura alba]|uniref:hypothetical protein n=1 Tax=Actinomadura alba TaxID=406431 RepID=UPI0031D69F9A